MKLIQQIHEYLRARGLLDADTEGKLRATGLIGPDVSLLNLDDTEGALACDLSARMKSEVGKEENLEGKLEEALEVAATGARTGPKRSGGKGSGRGSSKRRATVVVDEVKLALRIRATLATPATQAELAPLVWLAGGRTDRMSWPEAAKVLAGSDPQALARRLALGFGKRLGLDKAWRAFGYRPAFLGGYLREAKGPALTGWRLILDGADLKGLGKHAWVLGTPAIATAFHLIQAQRRLRRACGWVYAGHATALADGFRQSTDSFARETFLIYHNAQRWAGTAMASRKEVARFYLPASGPGARIAVGEVRSWAKTALQERRLVHAINAACIFGGDVRPFYEQAFENFPMTCPIEWIHK